MKHNSDDDLLPAIHIERLRSRIDEGLTSLNRGEGTDGAKFMEEMLGGAVDSREAENQRQT